MQLVVSHVSKSYPGLPVLHDISFDVPAGEILCLLGPSGVGKSTLLHIIAGLDLPDTGQVLFAGRDLAHVPVHRRHFGLMFQDFALFPHKDVFANVAFGLRMAGMSRQQTAQRVAEMLALVKMSDYERRSVLDLSGGEKQRVALARSLAPGPSLLMLDEPLGSLDRSLREELMHELRTILKRVGVTALYVTHDQEEAFTVADRILIMRARLDLGQGGHIEQDGTPQDVYLRPATPFVARFMGFSNLLPGTIAAPGQVTVPTAGLCSVETAVGLLQVTCGPERLPAGHPVTVLIRPEAAEAVEAIHPVAVGETGAAGTASTGATAANVIEGRLESSTFRGSSYLVQITHLSRTRLAFEITGHELALPAPGAPIALRLRPQAITLMPAQE